MSEQEPPALWEESLEGPPAEDAARVLQRIEDAYDRLAAFQWEHYADQLVAEWWERWKDDLPWADSPPGPE